MIQSVINTREKIGAVSKRIIKFCHEQQSYVFQQNQILNHIQQYNSDSKKIVEVIYMLLGLGLIRKISKNSFIYTGIKGIQESYIEFSKNEKIDYFNFQEEIKIADKLYQIKQFTIIQQISQNILFMILNSPNKQITKNEYDQIFNKYYQKENYKIISNDFLNVIQSLGLIIKNEDTDIIEWIDDKKSKKKEFLDENNFLKSLYLEENQVQKQIKIEEDVKIQVQDDSLIIPKEYMPKQQLQNSFPNSGFALLKGKSFRYILKKLQIIVGRQPQSNKQYILDKNHYKWIVDVNIPVCKNVSKQHAAILYNFQEGKFEIKCLSKKFPIMINKKILTWSDKSIELRHKSTINIGNEQLTFYLPKNEYENKE